MQLQDKLEAQHAVMTQLKTDLAASRVKAQACSQAMEQQLAAQAAGHQQQVFLHSTYELVSCSGCGDHLLSCAMVMFGLTAVVVSASFDVMWSTLPMYRC